ncbi:unnamed protein product [Hermetia illucens]|uniref:Nucleolar complex protein 2 homolog n=1 Tax=Hermetia illucens TaxID=343691 RepID=A0A7R8YXY5_HERIL|nr:nucleolar complex protein 2 homolog [Hermetia illucens]CAD7089478.1 unnamed protein product [Hermetia illucens]
MKVKSKGPVVAARPKSLDMKKKPKKPFSNGVSKGEVNDPVPAKPKILKPEKEAKAKQLKKEKKTKPKENGATIKDEKDSSEAEITEDLPKTKKSKTAKKSESKLHKKDLESLKEIDPEFYNFLQQNDKKLLDFALEDSDGEEAESDGEAEDQPGKDDDEEMVHKPSGELEVASDESDFHDSDDDDDEDGKPESKVVTLKLLRQWQSDLQGSKVKAATIRNAMQAFSAALASVSDGEKGKTTYKVEGAAAFNGVIQLCVLHLQPAIHRFLGMHEKSQLPIHKSKNFKRVRAPLKTYLIELSLIVEHVSSSNILRVILKHLHQVGIMLMSFPWQVTKPILKRLVVLWSTAEEETVRVLAFLCILKITRNQQKTMLNNVLKAMYLAYVRNSKFVSPNTLANINFMRRSLVEMFALDLNTTYQHAFLYIRQLAIYLRNAVILKKKDSFRAIYNWQYVNSIRLWADLLGATAHKPQLQPLVYPLISITTGVVKLIPTAQYFPLRFHCIQALISLQKRSNTFIPILPFILEVLNSNEFNKKHTIVSMKPMSFACVIRLNKPQLAENGFRDEVVEQVCGLMLEYLAHESCSLAYPDLVVPCVLALKQYLKICKNANYSRKLKQLLDKIVENSKFVEQERKKVNFGLQDRNLVTSWETQLRNKGTPLDVYYSSWVKAHEMKRKRQAANTDDINDFDIPKIKRKKGEKQSEGDDGPVELFPSGSEDEGEVNGDAEKAKKEKKSKNKLKEKKAKVPEPEAESEAEEEDDNVEDVDIVKDLDLNDW